ncbi:unnamed protein product [Rotaria sp. Silwood1]|nr:unnamed protein product [Rotaria sp. Silwood1]
MLGSIFKIQSVTEGEIFSTVKLSLCNEKDHQLKELTNYLRSKLPNKPNFYILGDLLDDMSEYEKAERCFQRGLNCLNDHNSKEAGNCFTGLGNVVFNRDRNCFSYSQNKLYNLTDVLRQMATVNETNLCSICHKPSVKYFCIGCKKYFCPKDFKEHEQQLSMKFDNEIVRSHDELLDQIEKLEKSNYLSLDLFAQIEQWKKTTINKVEKAAERAHHELIELIDKKRVKITEQLEPITKEIRCHREEETFVENDIDRLKQKLNEVQETLQKFIRKDTTKTIIIDDDRIDWNRIIYIQGEQQNCEYVELNI